MIVSMDYKDLPAMSNRERDMIRQAARRPIVCDEECPELSDEELSLFVRASDNTRKKTGDRT